jgi:hypothetical protein
MHFGSLNKKKGGGKAKQLVDVHVVFFGHVLAQLDVDKKK